MKKSEHFSNGARARSFKYAFQGLKVFSVPGTMPSFTCWVLYRFLYWQL